MEYCISLTYKCNISCPFCFINKNNSSNPSSIKPNITKIVNYISQDIKSRGLEHAQNSIVFSGGEPLLEWKAMEAIIEQTKGLPVDYMVYTNGTLLDELPINILSKIKVILLSFDGDKAIQERLRGENTYEKVVNNIRRVRPRLRNTIFIQRLTIEEYTDIYKSVINVIDEVDRVHWQIVNKPKFKDPDKFIENYKTGLKKLFEFWLAKLSEGKVLDIIPFQAVITSLLFPQDTPSKSFRCGCGSRFQAIDSQGNIYECDEYIGITSKKIGTIEDVSPISLNYKPHWEIFDKCRKCEYSNICLGRCKRALESYKKDQLLVYCELTRSLIEMIEMNFKDIEYLTKVHNLKPKDIYKKPFCTEEIP